MARVKKETAISFPATTCRTFAVVVHDGNVLGTANLDGMIDLEPSYSEYDIGNAIGEVLAAKMRAR